MDLDLFWGLLMKGILLRVNIPNWSITALVFLGASKDEDLCVAGPLELPLYFGLPH